MRKLLINVNKFTKTNNLYITVRHPLLINLFTGLTRQAKFSTDKNAIEYVQQQRRAESLRAGMVSLAHRF